MEVPADNSTTPSLPSLLCRTGFESTLGVDALDASGDLTATAAAAAAASAGGALRLHVRRRLLPLSASAAAILPAAAAAAAAAALRWDDRTPSADASRSAGGASPPPAVVCRRGRVAQPAATAYGLRVRLARVDLVRVRFAENVLLYETKAEDNILV